MDERRRNPGPAYFVGGGRCPADLVELSPPPLTQAQCASLADMLALNDLAPEATPPNEPPLRFFTLVGAAHVKLLRNARFFVPEEAELIGFHADEQGLRIAVPRILFHAGLSTQLFLNLTKGFAHIAQQGGEIAPWLAKLKEQLASRDRPSSNSYNFTRAAFELGLPVIEWPSRQMQIGYGNRGTVLRGSITQDTASIGVTVAKQKGVCKALLSQAGFPVAEGAQVASLAQAREHAVVLGYPVVIKPADLDGGEAVCCDIRSDEELVQGFEVARAASPNVVIERHIDGRDYRLLFFRGELIKQIERVPGGVTGNGHDSVEQLLAQMNADPARRSGRDSTLYPLEFDQEAALMLRRRSMTLASVPADGEWLQLRRAANFSLGGTAKLIEGEIHPDNLDLCRRALRLLRLDLAGLDLLLPDITRSWREAGGVICEINAQPFIGETIRRNSFNEILEGLLPEGGRIPLILVLGALDGATIEAVAARVPQLAVIDEHGARLDGHPLTRGTMSWLQACQAAVMDPETAAALCILDPLDPSAVFSPVDRFSAAYVLSAGEDPELPPHLVALLRRAGDNLAASAELGPMFDRAGLPWRPADPEALLEDLVAALS